MQQHEGNTLFSLRKAQDFLDAHADVLTGVARSGLRRRLDDAVTTLSGHASDQSRNQLSARGATKKHQSLRRVLLSDHMAPIARIARVELAATPEIEPLRMPNGQANIERLVAAANGMAKAAAPHAQTFIDAGLPEDFIKQLQDVARAVLDAQREYAQSVGRASAATSSLHSKLVDARRVVHALDALVSKALKDDRNLLDNWKQVKHVLRGRTAPETIAAPNTASAPVVSPTTPATLVAAVVPPSAPATAVAPRTDPTTLHPEL
jgi:hypothetical protein